MADKSIRDRILRTVQELDTLPTLPVIVERLKQEIENPKATARSVAALVEDDPPTMARVLKLVNSPVYAPSFGLGKNITIDQAVVRLGMNELRNIVITSSVMTLFPGGKGRKTFDRKEFWRHSICCGLVASALTDFINVTLDFTRSEMELAGLCHDLGKIMLDEYFHEAFVDVLESANRERMLFYEAELRYLNVEHGEVGGILAKRWALPDPIRHAIQYHHQLDKVRGRPTEPLVQLIHLADFICNHQGLGFSGNGRPIPFPKEYFEAFGLDVAKIPDIIERVREEAKKSEIFLSLAGS